MSILDDENILIDNCKNQTRAFHRILEISDVLNKPRQRQELIDYLNAYLTFDDYQWEGFDDGIALSIPNKWMSYAIAVRYDGYDYRFDFTGDEDNRDYVFIRESMINILELKQTERSKKHPEYLKKQYYKSKYRYEIF